MEALSIERTVTRAAAGVHSVHPPSNRTSSARICSNLRRSVNRFSSRIRAISGLTFKFACACCWSFRSIISSISFTKGSPFIKKSFVTSARDRKIVGACQQARIGIGDFQTGLAALCERLLAAVNGRVHFRELRLQSLSTVAHAASRVKATLSVKVSGARGRNVDRKSPPSDR